jgi:glutathione synthase/RimK-type ligase-like ATP-grasp enzyme
LTIAPEVLFVTNKDDFAIDFLIYKFKDNHIPYLRLNSEDITGCDVTWNFGNDVCFKFNDYEYSLKNLKSIYFRRAPTIFPNSSNHNDTPYINRERRDFFEGLYLTLDVKWINPIFATYISERKLYQLNVARNIGFDIPSTIVSNNPLEIKNFIDLHGNCIIKPISHGLQISKEGAFSIYTSEIKDIDFLEKDKLFECPAFVQSRIDNFRDIRATVIGNTIFAVEIEKDKIDDVDWRTPDTEKSYKVHTLPNNIVELMLKLHKALDLVYSAFDFVLTPEGEYYFLETNPAGEWVWLERELGLPISTAIINELIGL